MSSSSSTSPVKDFCDFLTQELRSLDGSFLSHEFMSIRFLESVLLSIRSLHTQLTDSIQKAHLPAGGKWIDGYMDETSRLWEVCLVLKSSFSNMQYLCEAGANAVSLLDAYPNLNPQFFPQVNKCVLHLWNNQESKKQSRTWWSLQRTSTFGKKSRKIENFYFEKTSRKMNINNKLE